MIALGTMRRMSIIIPWFIRIGTKENRAIYCQNGQQNQHSRKHHSVASVSPIITWHHARNSHSLNERTYSSLRNSEGSSDDFIFRQLLDYKSFTFTYLLADKESMQAILIDPVVEMVERDLRLIKDFGFYLVYGINTHVHADHITGTGKLKQYVPTCRSVIAEVSKAQADVKIKEGDKVQFGKYELEVRSTPGHTDGCLSYIFHEKAMVFTGDALLIRGCGRTDFQQGDSSRLYDSVHNKIFSLPHHFKVFPAHDYTGQTVSTVGEEVHFNPRLSKPRSEFIEIMNRLQLPYPKQIDKALPANMKCGIV